MYHSLVSVEEQRQPCIPTVITILEQRFILIITIPLMETVIVTLETIQPATKVTLEIQVIVEILDQMSEGDFRRRGVHRLLVVLTL